MTEQIPGMLIALAVGVAFSVCNYLLLRSQRKRADRLGLVFSLRQIINLGVLIGIYLLGGLTPWDPIYMLVAGAVGLTVPSMILTVRMTAKDGPGRPGGDDRG